MTPIFDQIQKCDVMLSLCKGTYYKLTTIKNKKKKKGGHKGNSQHRQLDTSVLRFDL